METNTETKGQTAERLFREGYNCCQAVAGAFAAETGLPQETLMRLASGFGGGFGRLREVCGTVSGMVLVAGLLHGYDTPGMAAEKTATYAMVQLLAEKFTNENGSIICRDLLGLSASNSENSAGPQAQARTEEYYRKRPCAQLCRIAADILADTVGVQPPALQKARDTNPR